MFANFLNGHYQLYDCRAQCKMKMRAHCSRPVKKLRNSRRNNRALNQAKRVVLWLRRLHSHEASPVCGAVQDQPDGNNHTVISRKNMVHSRVMSIWRKKWILLTEVHSWRQMISTSQQIWLDILLIVIHRVRIVTLVFSILSPLIDQVYSKIKGSVLNRLSLSSLGESQCFHFIPGEIKIAIANIYWEFTVPSTLSSILNVVAHSSQTTLWGRDYCCVAHPVRTLRLREVKKNL